MKFVRNQTIKMIQEKHQEHNMYLYNKITVHIPDILKIFQCHKETNDKFTCSSPSSISLHSIHDSDSPPRNKIHSDDDTERKIVILFICSYQPLDCAVQKWAASIKSWTARSLKKLN